MCYELKDSFEMYFEWARRRRIISYLMIWKRGLTLLGKRCIIWIILHCMIIFMRQVNRNTVSSIYTKCERNVIFSWFHQTRVLCILILPFQHPNNSSCLPGFCNRRRCCYGSFTSVIKSRICRHCHSFTC